MKGLIDLHLHLDGSLSLESVKQLADMQNIEIGSDFEVKKKLCVDEGCRDLNEYLEKFEFPLTLLQEKTAISQAVYNLLEELKEQGLLYAEVRFAPQLHLKKGLTQDEVVQAAIEGMNRSEMKANLILCCMRGDNNHDQNIETVNVAAKYKYKGVCAIDLAGAEALYKTKNFKDIFELAVKNDLVFTIHAGEADGPESVYSALDFGAKRIGHGVQSTNDCNLLKRLADNNITLELCPTSNLNTAIYSSIKEYPLRQLINAGINVTVNTDNMSVSNTTLQREIIILQKAFDLTDDEIIKLQKNAVAASFADEKTKQSLYKDIQEFADI